MKLLRKLKPFDRKTGKLNVVIDTPKGCRNKYAFDFDLNGYVLKTVMPKGMLFPFDFGSIPGTTGQDGESTRCISPDGRAGILRLFGAVAAPRCD
jgi:inorganic pyrophosphatase